MKTLIIYHSSCRDGFCAAFVIRHALLTDYFRQDELEFHPAHYGTPAPDVTGKHVYIADFCYPLEVMRKIATDAESLTVFDHHKTAEPILKDLDAEGLNCEICFDNNRSGARLAWDYFRSFEEPWWLIQYVEDRDLWRWALPNSKAVNAYIATLPFEFGAWEQVRMSDTAESVVEAGRAVLAKILRGAEAGFRQARFVTFAGHENIPVINAACSDISDVLDYAIQQTGAPFSVGWFQRADGLFQYSLRSRDGFDVAELAKKFGGGGHKAAAGFEAVCLPCGLDELLEAP